MTKKALKIFPLLLLPLFLLSFRHPDFERTDCPYPLKQLALYSDGTGWGLSLDNEILYTTQGLEAFEPVKTLDGLNPASDEYVNAAFVDEQTAYITCFSSDNEHLVIESTHDCGITWNQTLIPYDNKTCDAGSAFLCFEDSTHGYLLHCSTPAMGQMKKLLYATEDAGKTFTFLKDLTDTIAGYPQEIATVKDNAIQIAVTYHGTDSYLYQSSDNAKTWKPVEIFPRTADISYIDAQAPVYSNINPQNGMILLKVVNEKTAACRLYTTKDGGTSWQYDSEILCDDVRSFCLSGGHKVYVVDIEGNVYQK